MVFWFWLICLQRVFEFGWLLGLVVAVWFGVGVWRFDLFRLV